MPRDPSAYVMFVAMRVSPRKMVTDAPVTFLTVSTRSDLSFSFVVPSSICPSALTLQTEPSGSSSCRSMAMLMVSESCACCSPFAATDRRVHA